MKKLAGGCLCGALRYECSEPVSPAAVCHCKTCRRAAGAHAVAWATVRRSDFRFTQGAPTEFSSTPPVVRTFCATCGTSTTYWTREAPDLIDITLATLDDAGAIAPADHIWMRDAVSWDRPNDGLPQFCTSRSAGERFTS